jgi:hypothetical protein
LIPSGKQYRIFPALVLAVIGLLLTVNHSVHAAKALQGQWTLTITIPDSPQSATTRTLSVKMDVSPRGESLHGRVNISDLSGRTVGGAWRQVGKRVSIAYELPCPGDGPCASLILLGKVKGDGFLIKKGTVIVMWDTSNERNPSLYDTSNGSFRGDRLQ